MSPPAPDPVRPAAGLRVFVDFDNTITVGDVLDGLIERFAVGDRWRELEREWAAGRLGARDCLDGQLRSLRGTWPEFEAELAVVQLDAGFAALLEAARRAGAELTILSDNFDRFIQAILRRHGLDGVPVCANHLEFAGDRLEPSFPHYNPACPGCAHCKKTHFVPRRDARRVIYVGDGRSDLCPAREADIVFAKAGLLTQLRAENVPCRPFDGLAGVAAALLRLPHEDHR